MRATLGSSQSSCVLMYSRLCRKEKWGDFDTGTGWEVLFHTLIASINSNSMKLEHYELDLHLIWSFVDAALF